MLITPLSMFLSIFETEGLIYDFISIFFGSKETCSSYIVLRRVLAVSSKCAWALIPRWTGVERCWCWWCCWRWVRAQIISTTLFVIPSSSSVLESRHFCFALTLYHWRRILVTYICISTALEYQFYFVAKFIAFWWMFCLLHNELIVSKNMQATLSFHRTKLYDRRIDPGAAQV